MSTDEIRIGCTCKDHEHEDDSWFLGYCRIPKCVCRSTFEPHTEVHS